MDFDPTSIPFPVVAMAIGHYLALIMACLQGWTSESVAVWRELTGYLLVKAYHCKYTNSASEHECVIYEFVDEHKNKLLLRTDRHIGARRHTSSSSCSTSSAFDGGSSSPHPESDSKASSGSSDISSNKYLANDTIVRVQGHPDGCEVLKTITFNGDRSSRPSLWDVGILVLVVHNDGPLYTLHARQCYWFADTIFGALEMWENGTVVPDERGKVKRGRRRASIGSRGIVSVHRRKPEHIAKIWDSFKKLLQIMTQQKEEYERVRTEEVERMERLTGQVEQLTSTFTKEEREWEERERQLRKEEEEIRQRCEEENRELKQEVANLRRELQQKDRELQINASVSGRRCH